MTFFDTLDELVLTGGFVVAGAAVSVAILAAFSLWGTRGRVYMPRADSAEAVDSICWSRAAHLAGWA
ncbi:MAG: hypothetical protein WB691_06535 [Pseudolabrys sp.]